jgi:replication factor C small subunit
MNFDNLWVEKYRPKTLKDVILSDTDRKYFESIQDKKDIPHLLFAGVQGSGKSTTTRIIVKEILDCQYLFINSSEENGIDVVRNKIGQFARTMSLDGNVKVVILEEMDNASLEHQKALRNVMEEFAEGTRFIITCNYLFKIIAPIQSRCQIVQLVPPLEGTVRRVGEILKAENIQVPADQKPLLIEHIRQRLPDIRRIINDIQMSSVGGILSLKNSDSKTIAFNIYTMLKKDSVKLIRKFCIENEKSFGADYRQLLKDVFEVVFEKHDNAEQSTELMIRLAKGIEVDNFVVDKEINAFATLVDCRKILS